MELTVTAIEDTAPQIRTFTLSDPAGASLPSFVAGSHLLVECGLSVNAYSLIGESSSPASYSISVLRASDEGGSGLLHSRRTGDRIRVRSPRSAFAPVSTAGKHLLIAAGIGVTPILSHLRWAQKWGREAEVLYLHRAGRGAHAAALQALAPGSVRRFTSRDDFTRALEHSLGAQPIGTHLYCCGPAAFMDAVCVQAELLGWPQGRVHTETFGSAELDPGDPFDVQLTRSGRTLSVPSGRSLLEVLEENGVGVPNLCRKGFCGECRIPVSAGTPLHRDQFLDADARASNESMMCCVSRSQSQTLEVPL